MLPDLEYKKRLAENLPDEETFFSRPDFFRVVQKMFLLLAVVLVSACGDSRSRPESRCTDFSPARMGWLLDHDRRGEVALWTNPAQPFVGGNTISSVVSFEGLPLGESMITEVTRECSMGDGILYYYVPFEAGHAGWVDVDYLHWKKVRR
jgi:hypothetical protein